MKGIEVLLYVLWISALLLAVHAITRPRAVWVRAERNRGFWVVMLVMLGFFMVIPYVLVALPRVLRASSEDTSSDFSKR